MCFGLSLKKKNTRFQIRISSSNSCCESAPTQRYFSFLNDNQDCIYHFCTTNPTNLFLHLQYDLFNQRLLSTNLLRLPLSFLLAMSPVDFCGLIISMISLISSPSWNYVNVFQSLSFITRIAFSSVFSGEPRLTAILWVRKEGGTLI